MTSPQARIVGLDLSLTATGIAYPDGTTETIRTALKGMARLEHLRTNIIYGCNQSYATVVYVEGYSFGSRDSQAHALGELGGVIRLALYHHQIPYVDVPPSTLKKYATGKGNAGKEEVLAAAIRRLGYDGHDNNQADALWLRAIGMDLAGSPVVTVPATHRTALDKLREALP